MLTNPWERRTCSSDPSNAQKSKTTRIVNSRTEREDEVSIDPIACVLMDSPLSEGTDGMSGASTVVSKHCRRRTLRDGPGLLLGTESGDGWVLRLSGRLCPPDACLLPPECQSRARQSRCVGESGFDQGTFQRPSGAGLPCRQH
jgi:hypothetical protein